jgi:predicted kinase
MMQRFILVRGLPGSGKSTLAKRMLDNQIVDIHLEADQWFTNEATGEYRFNPNELFAAHQYCQRMAFINLSIGNSVVVSNTFTTRKELRPYLEIARQTGVKAEILTCKGQYGSVHGVPVITLAAMRNRWVELEPSEDEYILLDNEDDLWLNVLNS